MKALVDTIPLRAQVRWQFQILVDPLRLNKQQPLLHNANKNILSFTFIQTNWITLFNFTDYNLQPEKKTGVCVVEPLLKHLSRSELKGSICVSTWRVMNSTINYSTNRDLKMNFCAALEAGH